MVICHCFAYTQEAIEQDLVEHGTSTILARILAEHQRGTCRCAEQNPKGT